MSSKIFETDIKGLRELHEGRGKWFIVRELVANAFDENITKCEVNFSYERGKAIITVIDDSPEGFKDLSDAYTLFKSTPKRENAEQRGRFNAGEKEIICVSDFVRITTTTGGVEFDVKNDSKKILRKKRPSGSEVYVEVKMSKEEFAECIGYCNKIFVPEGIKFTIRFIDGVAVRELTLQRIKPYKTFVADLITEIKEDGMMKKRKRSTAVNIYKPQNTLIPFQAMIYEMGIPVCEIDCDYSIDVQQKVPLSTDRSNVDAKYLKTLYGEVLNIVHKELEASQSSNSWVRTGFTAESVSKAAVKDVVAKRYGEKALIANNFDRRSMDEAIKQGFNVVVGSEMSKEEWAKIKEHETMESTSSVFGVGYASSEAVKPTVMMQAVSELCKRIAKVFMDRDISVWFFNSAYDTPAEFKTDSNEFRFNVNNIPKDWWGDIGGTVHQEMLKIIIGEFGHVRGKNYEQSYHDCVIELGSKLTLKAIEDKNFFKL